MSVASPSQIDIPKTRLRNVLTLHQEFVEKMVSIGTSPSGLERLFAEHLKVSPSLWSQIKSGRTIGNKLARQVENAAKRPFGWLDTVHAETVQDPSEERFLALCKDAWKRAGKQERQAMTRIVKEAAAGLKENPK